jgi:hypothetical protein
MKAKQSISDTIQIVPRDLRRRHLSESAVRRLRHCRLPPLFRGTGAAELALPSRARKYFERKGYFQRPEAVANLTLGDLAKVRGLGILSIIEIVEALYRCAESRGFKAPKAIAAPAPRLTPNDLQRLRRWCYIPTAFYGHRLPLIPRGATLADLRLTGRSLAFFQRTKLVENPAEFSKLTVAELVARPGIGEMTVLDIAEALFRCADLAADRDNRTLDDELLLWLAPRQQRLRRRIVVQRFGIGGRPALTLEAIGALHGYTRERIRQFVSPRSSPPGSLVLKFEAAAETISALIPVQAAAAEARLVERGLIGPGAKLEMILRVAALLGRETGFILEGAGRQCRAQPDRRRVPLRRRQPADRAGQSRRRRKDCAAGDRSREQPEPGATRRLAQASAGVKGGAPAECPRYQF